MAHHSHDHSDEHGLWESYLELLTDPAHILFELTISVGFDLLVVYLGYQIFLKRIIIPRLRRDIHREIDAEHHVEHHDHEGGPRAECSVDPRLGD